MKLKAMLASLDEALDTNNINGAVSEYPAQSTTVQVQPYEVKKAKQTFDQLKNTDYNTMLSLGEDKKLENAIDVLMADAKYVGQGEIQRKLINIQEQLKFMKNDHESASQDLANYSTFSSRRSELRDELKKDVSMARELENVEVELNNRILHAKAKREELLKQLDETESNIKDAEKAQGVNMEEVDELMSRIEHKSGRLKEMKMQEKSWQVKKHEAERVLEGVEKDWGKIINMFPDTG